MSYMIEFTDARYVKPVLRILEQQGIRWATGHRATFLESYFFATPTTLDHNYLIVHDTINGGKFLMVGNSFDLVCLTLKKDIDFLKESTFHDLIIINT